MEPATSSALCWAFNGKWSRPFRVQGQVTALAAASPAELLLCAAGRLHYVNLDGAISYEIYVPKKRDAVRASRGRQRGVADEGAGAYAAAQARVVHVACGRKHAACVDSAGEVFSWGSYAHGCAT